MNAAQVLIDRLLMHPDDAAVGRIANDLLREFWNGYPLSALRELLHNPNEEVFKAALFILSELAHKGRPLLDELPRLLSHPMSRARIEAVESAMTVTLGTDEDASVIAAAFSLVDDPDKGVRCVARHFLLMASDAQLHAALGYKEKCDPGSAHTTGLKWLLSPAARSAPEVIRQLEDKTHTNRYYAIAAATRLAADDRTPLDAAHASVHAEVREGAEQAERTIELLAQLLKLRRRDLGK